MSRIDEIRNELEKELGHPCVIVKLETYNNDVEMFRKQKEEIEKLNLIHNDYRKTALDRIAYQENQIKSLQKENEQLKQMLVDTYGFGWTIEFERMFAK